MRLVYIHLASPPVILAPVVAAAGHERSASAAVSVVDWLVAAWHHFVAKSWHDFLSLVPESQTA
jgi:hypothetical protein